MSSVEETNARLRALYINWRQTIAFEEKQSLHLSPPLLLTASSSYVESERKIMFIGQETFGWSWSQNYRESYPLYQEDFCFGDIQDLSDFVHNRDAVDALMWGYKTFDFARYQPITHRSPFWQAFREVRGWPGSVGLIWNNCSRFDYDGGSILWAPSDVQKQLAIAQEWLFKRELEILKPDVCLFFSGPNYDWIIQKLFPRLKIEEIENLPERTLCRVMHSDLPYETFRSYHPAYLSRSKQWGLISKIKELIK